MKKVDVLNCKEFLSDLKLNKFDKEIRTAIVTNSMVANRISKDFNEATKEATSRYTKDIKSEVGTLEMLRNKYQSASSEEKIEIEKEIIEKCPNALTAEKELNEFVNNMLNEEVTESFIKIDKETFIDQCAEANIDITVNMLELFNELFK